MSELEIGGADEVADWVEATLLVRGARQLGGDALDALAADEVGIEPVVVNLALREMRRRAKVLGSAYPFADHDVAVRAHPDARRSVYSFLLLMSPRAPFRLVHSPVPSERFVTLFEEVTASAAAGLLGEGSAAMRFGWPSDVGRPKEFDAAVRWLAEKIGIDPGIAYRPPRRKDGGVDVVGWRAFADGRSGFPILLVQCTMQSEIKSKALDIDVVNWASWLALDRPPMTALAVPQCITKKVDWDEIALHTMPLDRLRLAGLVMDPGDDLRAEIEGTIADAVETLSGSLRGAE